MLSDLRGRFDATALEAALSRWVRSRLDGEPIQVSPILVAAVLVHRYTRGSNRLATEGSRAIMRRSAVLTDPEIYAPGSQDEESEFALRCPLPVWPLQPGAVTADLCMILEEEGCPLAPAVQKRIRFETLLAELSATFVNLPPGQVDAQIESALGRLIEFLEVDRGGLAEVLLDKKQLVITHSFHAPGVPMLPRIIVNEQLPWYASEIQRGDILRLSALPDDLPAEAVQEREYCVREGLKSHVMIPLKMMDSVVGAIGFGSFRGRHEWPDDLVQRLRLVGEIFANALARKRADEELRARERSLVQAHAGLNKLAAKLIHAQEEERRRIAREMHDDWTQRLAILSIDAAQLEKQLGRPDQALPILRSMHEKLVELSEDVHALSRQLHPSIVDDLGLVDALRSECASFSRREGIAVSYNPEPFPTPLAKDRALCIYRVAQEALRNVAKHAGVRHARVSLFADGKELVLRVEDKGAGFDASATRSQAGLGLSSVQERVRLVGGRHTITSAPGQGTSIEVRVPLARGEA